MKYLKKINTRSKNLTPSEKKSLTTLKNQLIESDNNSNKTANSINTTWECPNCLNNLYIRIYKNNYKIHLFCIGCSFNKTINLNVKKD